MGRPAYLEPLLSLSAEALLELLEVELLLEVERLLELELSELLSSSPLPFLVSLVFWADALLFLTSFFELPTPARGGVDSAATGAATIRDVKDRF